MAKFGAWSLYVPPAKNILKYLRLFEKKKRDRVAWDRENKWPAEPRIFTICLSIKSANI